MPSNRNTELVSGVGDSSPPPVQSRPAEHGGEKAIPAKRKGGWPACDGTRCYQEGSEKRKRAGRILISGALQRPGCTQCTQHHVQYVFAEGHLNCAHCTAHGCARNFRCSLNPHFASSSELTRSPTSSQGPPGSSEEGLTTEWQAIAEAQLLREEAAAEEAAATAVSARHGISSNLRVEDIEGSGSRTTEGPVVEPLTPHDRALKRSRSIASEELEELSDLERHLFQRGLFVCLPSPGSSRLATLELVGPLESAVLETIVSSRFSLRVSRRLH